MQFLTQLFTGPKPLQERVYTAVKNDDVSGLRNLIQHLPDRAPYSARPSQVLVPDLEFVGASGRTPICLAARQNSVAIVQLLLAKGASLLVCSPVRDGGTPMHEAAATSANEAALELLRHGASPFVVNRHNETAYEIAMRRDNKQLLRLIERSARISAFMQVRMSATGMMGMLPSRGKFLEKWVVLAPREPPPDAPPASRVIHSQLLIYNDHVSNQPVAKLWVDGATMTVDRDRYLLKLHHSHTKPTNVRVETDDGGLLCVALRDSSRVDHHGQVMRLMQVVNDNAREAYAAHTQPPPAQPQPPVAHALPPPQRPAAQSARVPAQPSTPTAARPAPAATAAATAGHAAGAAPAGWTAAAAVPSAPAQVGAGRSDEEVAADLQRREMEAARISHTELQSRMEAMRTASTGDAPPISACAAAIATPPPAANPSPPVSSGPGKPAAVQKPAAAAAVPPEDDLCCICMEEPKRTAFIHGDTSHLCACKACATSWFQQHRKCPVCGQACAMTVDVYS